MTDPNDDRITVYSDYVCPFCYLGRQSLSRYQAGRDDALRIDWRPFDLRAQKRGPDGTIDHDVDDGKDDEYYDKARENVRRLSEKYGVEMAQEIATDVDSLPAQVASYHVRETHSYEQWLSFDTALFEALWEDGRDIGDPDVVADVAADVGLDPEAVAAAATDPDRRAAVEERFDEARREGVTGVPTFAYEGYAARGAVPPEHLERLVEGT